jgi:ABC-type Fe3+-hydroxamate transport system substrate-binding protein
LNAEPTRIVSLVPSVSEALFELGLGDRVVGVTDWCVHPARSVARLPKVGGTKNPNVAAILALAPELVIANREENTKRTVEALEAQGLRVWVTYPRSVRDGVTLLRELCELGASPAARRRVLEPVERALAEAERRVGKRRRTRVFCPIWRDPWMSIGRDTYAHDLIRLCGGENVFADCGDRRYPRVDLRDVESAGPEVILLPDEPYRFGREDAAELMGLDVPAARQRRIHLIDGTLVSWYGPRIYAALGAIRVLLAGSRGDECR